LGGKANKALRVAIDAEDFDDVYAAFIDDWSGGPRRHFDADTFPLGLTVRTTSFSPRRGEKVPKADEG